ncbi:DUF2784 domain-containing protein [Deltaproteobacteria bacterium PRO3]|nr:DUF2784 domain-containing protein [Deltaproteobacteria bacterium PRO3]
MREFLADTILVLHFLYIAGLVIPVPFIALGYPLGWHWVRRPLWRRLHLAAVLFLIVQTVVGFTCPLTDWEVELRLGSGQPAYEESFVEHWVGRWIFFEWDEKYFTVIYLIFSLTVVWLYRVYPPDRDGKMKI